MPDELSNLIGELGYTEAAPTTTETTETATTETTAAPEATAITTEAPVTTDVTPEATPEVTEPEDSTHKAFAALRTKNATYAKFFARLKEATGADEEAVMQSLLEQATNSQAQELKTDPSVLKRLQEQEEKLQAYESREKEQALVFGLDSLQKEFKLEKTQIEKFVKDAITKGIDLRNTNLDFKTIYQGMYFKELAAAEIEKSRQEFIKTQTKADKATVPSTMTGQRDDKEPTVINDMNSFNSLLSSLNK